MYTESKKIERSVSHNANDTVSGATPWWGSLISDLINAGSSIGGKFIDSKQAPTPTVTPPTNNNNNNNNDNNNTLLYVAAGAVVVLLVVVLLKK